jgi:hypothetical protein
MVLFVKERPVPAKSRIDISLGKFPRNYWQYLLVTALFGIGNSSNSFLILQTTDIGASLEATILIYAAFNLIAALSVTRAMHSSTDCSDLTWITFVSMISLTSVVGDVLPLSTTLRE